MKKLHDPETITFKSLVDIISETKDYIKYTIGNQNGTNNIWLDTGYPELDKMTCGLLKGNITLIAARPSMGSTSLSLNITENMLSAGKRVAIFSLEMSAPEVMLRLATIQTSIPLQKLRSGGINSEQYKLLNDAIQFMGTCYTKLFIDDQSSKNINQICTQLRQLKNENPDLDLVVIDTLQMIRSSAGESVNEIMYQLKSLAVELDIAMIVLSKLNSKLEWRVNKRPVLSDIPESDLIEQYADTVLFIYRDDFYLRDQEKEREQRALIRGEDFISCYVEKEEEEAEIIIAKQRNGSIGHIKLLFQKKFARFIDHPMFGAAPIVYEMV